MAYARLGLMPSFDSASRQRLRIFAFKLLLVIPFSVILARHRDFSLPATLWFFFCWHAAFSGLAGLLQRHRPGAATLTAWDEVAAFIGLAALARLADAVG
jgi:hypothetical protein